MDHLRMSDTFVLETAKKVIFGFGAIKEVGREAGLAFGSGKKVLMVTDRGVVGAGLTVDAISSLKDSGFHVIVFDEVVPDPPIPMVLKAVEMARREGADIIMGIGGGSCIDAAKAVALMVPHDGDIHDLLGMNRVKSPGIPKIFVPTTAGTGSEVGLAFVLSDQESGDKITSYTPYAASDLSIIDPGLTLSMPAKVTADSGMDAFSHALEAFVGARANPMSDLFARRAIELISKNIRRAYAKGEKSPEARYAMCLGSYLAIMAARTTGIGLVHSTCYPPAMKYHLSHGESICMMMPSVMEYNLMGNVEKFAALASAMGEVVDSLSTMDAAEAAIGAVGRLIRDLGLGSRLRDIGAGREDFPKFARTVMKRYVHHFANNPRDVTEQGVLGIYESAW